MVRVLLPCLAGLKSSIHFVIFLFCQIRNINKSHGKLTEILPEVLGVQKGDPVLKYVSRFSGKTAIYLTKQGDLGLHYNVYKVKEVNKVNKASDQEDPLTSKLKKKYGYILLSVITTDINL